MEKQRFTRFWIIIAAAFLLVVLIIFAWFISLEVSKKDLFESYNQQQLLFVNGAASGIEGLFNDLAVNLGVLADRPEIQYFDETGSRRELAQKMTELAPLGVSDLGILDSRGTARFFVVENQLEGINYAWRSYFKAAQALNPSLTSQNTFVEIQTTSQAEAGFTVAIPIFETAVYEGYPEPGGDFAGIILGSLTLDTLTERYIAPFKPPGEGQIYLMNQDYDIVWSSDPQTNRRNLLGIRQDALEGLVDRMSAWRTGSAQAGSYIFTPTARAEKVELIAYAPIDIGQEQMVIFVKTPAAVARQTSLSSFQNQQLVFILSISTLLIGILSGGLVLRRESQRRFQAETALRESETEQAILAERNRLAGDLHDSVTQGLYGIVLHADAALGQISAGRTDQAAAYLQEIKQTGKEGLAEMRLLIFELRPPVLEKEGLVPALEARLYAVEKRAGLQVEMSSHLKQRIPRQIEEAFYRIAQESLNNTLKHAQAKSIRLCLDCTDSVVSMEIKDDGKGFDPSSNHKHGGMGLETMKERAGKIGGRMEVDSLPGQGTRVFVEVNI